MLNQKKIVQITDDEYPLHPRLDFDCVGQIYALHKRYDFNEIKLDNSYCHSWDDELELLYANFDIAVILPLYLLDHSGLTVSSNPFGCRFDSGQLGYIFITKNRLRQAFNCKYITRNILAKGIECLKSEIKMLDQFLNGDIYVVRVLDENSNIIDECGSIYGYDAAQEIANELKLTA